MFKSLKTTDSQNLKAYVEFDSAIISDSKVYGSMFFNIVICLIGAFYIDSANIVKIAEIALILICSVFMLWFKFKVSKTQVNLRRYFVSFTTVISVNLCYVSCLFFSMSQIGFLIPAVIYAIAVPVVAFAIIKSDCNKIIKGAYLNKEHKVSPAIAIASSCGACIGVLGSRFIFDKISEEVVWGFCCGVMGLIMSMFSFNFVKWYCHKLLEQRETE